ncbi:MAG: RNA-directed DNA polymerase, partial [Deltaproteobacteria bacterium]|nr:RNA-directed DNA polymerase [Deltaproteobacteria bacterium]
MAGITVDHFKRAAADIGLHGDNDTLPFDIDNRFVNENQNELAILAYTYFCELEKGSPKDATKAINALQIFSERLLVPTGAAGFRITTKIHPFWNIYINGMGVAIADKHEAQRSPTAHSYRYVVDGDGLFDRSRSWRAYRQCTISPEYWQGDDAVVIQTDISSFYEHIYHHRLESCLEDLFPSGSTVASQIDRFLSKFASGRSFGLPVGGQCARILAEVLMSAIDNILTDEGIIWHRYVDDFTIMTRSQEEAYRALAVLSNALADYGLSLNRTKTIMLKAKPVVSDTFHSKNSWLWSSG